MAKTGVLLVNLGTPDAPTFWAVRRYLKEFLSDPYVIDLPRWKWWPILNLIILNIRPFKSAKNYRKIWTPQGSPLLVYSEKICAKLQDALPHMKVVLGMQYGNPSIKDAKKALQECEQVIVLPLYPQFSYTTYRDLPNTSYYQHPLYIKALKESIQHYWQERGKPEKLILSYHSLPKRYIEQGDPYYMECLETSRLLCETLHVNADFAITTFQSRVGLEEWLQPYTIETIADLAKQGVENIQVICPGFACDCLETLEEIDMQNRQVFLNTGGKKFGYIPCLNDSDAQITLLQNLVKTYAPTCSA